MGSLGQVGIWRSDGSQDGEFFSIYLEKGASVKILGLEFIITANLFMDLSSLARFRA